MANPLELLKKAMGNKGPLSADDKADKKMSKKQLKQDIAEDKKSLKTKKG